MKRLWIPALMALVGGAAHAQAPRSSANFPTNVPGRVTGSVQMGLGSDGATAWPCGSPNVVYGCASGGGGGGSSIVPSALATSSTVTVTTTPSTVVAGATSSRTFLEITNSTPGQVEIDCALGGTPTAGSGNYDPLVAYGAQLHYAAPAFVPTNAVSCVVASGTATLFVKVVQQ